MYHIYLYRLRLLHNGEHRKGKSCVLFHDTTLMTVTPNAWSIYTLYFEHATDPTPSPCMVPVQRTWENQVVSQITIHWWRLGRVRWHQFVYMSHIHPCTIVPRVSEKEQKFVSRPIYDTRSSSWLTAPMPWSLPWPTFIRTISTSTMVPSLMMENAWKVSLLSCSMTWDWWLVSLMYDPHIPWSLNMQSAAYPNHASSYVQRT